MIFFCFVFHITDIIIIYNIIIFFYSKILFFGLRSTDQIKLFGTKQNKIKSIKLLFLFSFIFSFPFSLDLFAMIFLRPRINPLIIFGYHLHSQWNEKNYKTTTTNIIRKNVFLFSLWNWFFSFSHINRLMTVCLSEKSFIFFFLVQKW